MSAEPGRDAVESFLRWAREVVRQDRGFLGEVERALAETTMSPELRRQVELELARMIEKLGREDRRADTERGPR